MTVPEDWDKIEKFETIGKELASKLSFPSDYEFETVSALVYKRRKFEGKKIPQHMVQHALTLDSWIRHENAKKMINFIDEAIKTNLLKYGITYNFLGAGFNPAYHADEQYKILKEKPINVVRRFKTFNYHKKKESLCSKINDNTKAHANYRACLRVLAERCLIN